MAVLKNCKPELSYILGQLFNMCLKVSSVVSVFKNVGERSAAKKFCPVSALSVIYK